MKKDFWKILIQKQSVQQPLILLFFLILSAFTIFMAMDETTEEKPVEKKSQDISKKEKKPVEETVEKKIELKLVTAEQNKYGNTKLKIQNCSSIDLSNAEITIRSSGPDTKLEQNVTAEFTATRNWGCNQTQEFGWLTPNQFVRYAQRCTATVKVDGEEFVFDFTEALIRRNTKAETMSRPTKRVVYIHGYQPLGKIFNGIKIINRIFKPDFSEEKKMLEKIFPGYEVDCYYWEAAPEWGDIKTLKAFSKYYEKAQNEEPKRLVEYLIKKYWEDLDNLILVGHSLGGVITVNTIKILAEKGRRIDRAIFLGTALPASDEVIEKLLHLGTHNYSINIHKPEDEWLEELSGWLAVGKSDGKALPSILIPFYTKSGGPRIFGGDGYALDHKKSVLLQIKPEFCGCGKYHCDGHPCVKHYLSTLEKFWRLKSEYGE